MIFATTEEGIPPTPGNKRVVFSSGPSRYSKPFMVNHHFPTQMAMVYPVRQTFFLAPKFDSAGPVSSIHHILFVV